MMNLLYLSNTAAIYPKSIISIDLARRCVRVRYRDQSDKFHTMWVDDSSYDKVLSRVEEYFNNKEKNKDGPRKIKRKEK